MQERVFCQRYQKEMEALKAPPYFGPIGDVIQKNCSQQAFDEWGEFQIKLINEERLDLSEGPAKERLFDAMISFLNLENFI